MSDIDNVKFSSILFTRETNIIFSVQASFNFGGSPLLVVGAEMPSYNEYKVNFDAEGTDTLENEISFLPALDNPAANPNVQNSVSIKFYDKSTEEYSSKKGNIKIRENHCPPPGSVSLGSGGVSCAGNYGIRIKTVNLVNSGSNTEVTITTENIDGDPSGYRIINNMPHTISTGGGTAQTWAFEIQDGNTVDTNNTFQFDFSTIAAEVALPILFYAEGTDINKVDQSDALLWIEQ